MIKKYFFSILLLLAFLASSCQMKREIKALNNYAHWYQRMLLFINEKDSIQEGSLIFFGNSIMEGFDLKAFFPEWSTVNRGIASDHIDGLIERMDICLGGAEQAKLFILIGINDIGAGRSEKDIRYLYRRMLQQIVENYPYEVYLHSILPTSPRWKNCPPQMIKDLNRYIEKLARRYNMTYINIYPLFKAEDSDYADEALFRDGLHPNREGYRLWAEYLRERIK